MCWLLCFLVDLLYRCCAGMALLCSHAQLVAFLSLLQGMQHLQQQNLQLAGQCNAARQGSNHFMLVHTPLTPLLGSEPSSWQGSPLQSRAHSSKGSTQCGIVPASAVCEQHCLQPSLHGTVGCVAAQSSC